MDDERALQFQERCAIIYAVRLILTAEVRIKKQKGLIE